MDVVLPLYRGREWVERTIASLHAQTFTDWKLIAVDDACPVDTGGLVAELSPSSAVLRLASNGGAPRARNIAVKTSNARYIALLDQDDLWHPRKLEKQVDLLESRPSTGACGTDAVLIDEFDNPLAEAASNQTRRAVDWDRAPIEDLLRAQFLSNRVKTASSVVRRQVWDEVGGQVEDAPGAEDWKLWFDILASGWRIGQIQEPLHLWRMHPGNTSRIGARDRRRKRMQVVYGLRYSHRLGVSTLARAALRAV